MNDKSKNLIPSDTASVRRPGEANRYPTIQHQAPSQKTETPVPPHSGNKPLFKE
jgi:hypothetical protein